MAQAVAARSYALQPGRWANGICDSQSCQVYFGAASRASVAFGTAPTVPTQFFRRFSLAALVGAAVVYTFPRGIVLPAGGQAIVAWNITANSAVVDIHAVVDE